MPAGAVGCSSAACQRVSGVGCLAGDCRASPEVFTRQAQCPQCPVLVTRSAAAASRQSMTSTASSGMIAAC